MLDVHFSGQRHLACICTQQTELECSQPDGKGSPNLTSSAACNMWTMPHKTQVVEIAMQHPFNRNTRLLPSDLSIFHSPSGKVALPAPKTIDYIFPSPGLETDHVRPYVPYSSARTIRVNVFLARRVSLRRLRTKRRGVICLYFAVKVGNIYDNDLKIIKHAFPHGQGP